MASHWLFSDSVNEVVPFNAKFNFPSQATRTLKSTVKLPPKAGKSVYGPGDTIRWEFPANGYLNPLATLLSLKCFLNFQWTHATMVSSTSSVNCNSSGFGRIQQNINSIFSRIRVMYGSLVLEDISGYGLLNRILTDAGVGRDFQSSLGLMANIGSWYDRACNMKFAGGMLTATSATISTSIFQQVSTLQPGYYNGGAPNLLTAYAIAAAPQTSFNPTNNSKRFVTPFLSGLLQQRKLIPLKWMSSQFAIELTIDPNPANYIIFDSPTQSGTSASASSSTPGLAVSGQPNFGVVDANILADIYEFDVSYDEAFFEGMKQAGIPIQFSSWHYSTYSMSGSQTNAQIQERSRSVKLALACVTSTVVNYTSDSHCTFSCVNPLVQSAAYAANGGSDNVAVAYVPFSTTCGAQNSGTNESGTAYQFGSNITSFQWRVGGRYFPAQPVEVHTSLQYNDGPEGVEALFELQKALDIVGAYQTGTLFNAQNWCNSFQQHFGRNALLNASLRNYSAMNRDTIGPYKIGTQSEGATTANGLASGCLLDLADHLDCAQAGGPFFIMAADFETSNGLEISGINAEEQSDILLQIKNDAPSQVSNYNVQLNVFVCYDALMIIKPNNVVDLIS
jgi:hypothetical protein